MDNLKQKRNQRLIKQAHKLLDEIEAALDFMIEKRSEIEHKKAA